MLARALIVEVLVWLQGRMRVDEPETDSHGVDEVLILAMQFLLTKDAPYDLRLPHVGLSQPDAAKPRQDDRTTEERDARR